MIRFVDILNELEIQPNIPDPIKRKGFKIKDRIEDGQYRNEIIGISYRIRNNYSKSINNWQQADYIRAQLRYYPFDIYYFKHPQNEDEQERNENFDLWNKINPEKIDETTQDDIKKASTINAIILYIDNQINNNNVKIINKSPYTEIHIPYKDLKIVLTSKHSNNEAEYINKLKTLIIYKCDISTKPKLEVKYNKEALFHELTHYIDLTQRFKGSLKQYHTNLNQKINKQGREAYINSPLEFNAHFFHHLYPAILNNIKQNKINPKESFGDFLTNIKNTTQFNSFYNELNNIYKRKLLKRIAGVYQEFKQPEKLQDLINVNIGNLENEQKKHTWLGQLAYRLKNL